MRSIFVFLFALFTFLQIYPQIRYSVKINSSTTINYGNISSPDKNTIYYVYRRGDNNSTEERQVKFASSTDAGHTFSETDITLPYGTFNSNNCEPTIVSTTTSVIAYYSIDSSGMELYCLARSTDKGSTFSLKTYRFDVPYFFNFISDGVSKYYLKYFEHFFVSTDNGATFVQKPNTIPGSLEASTPQFLWSAKLQNDSILVYRSSNDGVSFEFITAIATTIAEGTYFAYSAFGNELNIAWIDDEWGTTKLKMENITGNTAGPVHTIGPVLLMGYNTAPHITQTNNRIFVEYDLRVSYSTDKGNTWSRSSDQRAEAGPVSNIIAMDDTTFYTHSSEYLSNMFLNLWFHNSKWTDQPFSPLKNDTLITGDFLFIDAYPSVETSHYRLQISSSSDFSTLLLDVLSNNKAMSIYLPGRFPANGTTYFYRIRGEENNYLTLWSPSKTFIYGTTSGINENNTAGLNKYFLSQNYPNPFNPSTTIEYSIPRTENIIIKVYDILGKEMAVLVNEKKTAGVYNAFFDAGKMNSGVYFYRMIAGNFSQTRKFLLLK